MALSAQEQALLQSLISKSNEPEVAVAFNSVEEVVRELVRVSDKFSAQPEIKDAAIAFLDGILGKTTPAPVTE